MLAHQLAPQHGPAQPCRSSQDTPSLLAALARRAADQDEGPHQSGLPSACEAAGPQHAGGGDVSLCQPGGPRLRPRPHRHARPQGDGGFSPTCMLAASLLLFSRNAARDSHQGQRPLGLMQRPLPHTACGTLLAPAAGCRRPGAELPAGNIPEAAGASALRTRPECFPPAAEVRLQAAAWPSSSPLCVSCLLMAACRLASPLAGSC
jgi:hypothetical protein